MGNGERPADDQSADSQSADDQSANRRVGEMSSLGRRRRDWSVWQRLLNLLPGFTQLFARQKKRRDEADDDAKARAALRVYHLMEARVKLLEELIPPEKVRS